MKSITLRRSLLSLVVATFASAALLPATSFAYDTNSASAVNVDAKGLGLQGHDPVAYFTKGMPTLGRTEVTASHDGVVYQFASTANRDLFVSNPNKYAPQFGGFCAMGVALEKKLDGDPQAWAIVDDKLYLNVNKDVQKKWQQDVSGNNKKAEQHWPIIRGKTPKSLN